MIKVKQRTQDKILKIIDELNIKRAQTVKTIEQSNKNLVSITQDILDLQKIMQQLESNEQES